MSKQPSLRARASPAAVLVEREHAQLAEFVQRVGVAAYGTSWPKAAASSAPPILTDRRTVGSDNEAVWLIRDQVLLALQAGVITASVPLTVSRIPPPVRQPKVAEDEGWNLLNDDIDDDDFPDEEEDDDPEKDDDPPKLRVFRIGSAFWATPFDHTKLDWNASLVSVEMEHLFETVENSQPQARTSARSSRHSRDRATKRTDVPFLEKYAGPPSFSGVSIRILRPESALRSMFKYEELPDEAWLSRYEIYRDNIKCELIAAAWRYINIAKLEKKHGIKTKLVRAMQDYMRSQGLDVDAGQGPSEAVLMEMAARIVAQWEQENLSVSVLVSTNPRKPKI